MRIEKVNGNPRFVPDRKITAKKIAAFARERGLGHLITGHVKAEIDRGDAWAALYRFDSPEQVREAVDWIWDTRDSRPPASREVDASGWSGVKTWEDAVELVRSGWREGADRAAALSDRMLELVDEIRSADGNALFRRNDTVAEMDVSGAEVDVALFLEGEPENMVEYLEQDSVARTVRIVADSGAACFVKADEIIRRGAAVLALIDALEAAGHPVELCATCSTIMRRFGESGYQTKVCVFAVELKKAGQPVEVDRLAFALAHPAFLRRLSFAFAELTPRKVWDEIFSTCYGYPLNSASNDEQRAELELHRQLTIALSEADLFIDGIGRDREAFQSEETAAEWVAARIRDGLREMECSRRVLAG